jgi:hypothetical protein
VDVICNSVLQIRDPGHDEEPLVFVAMQLDRQHYESIGIVDKSDIITSAWAKEELPNELVTMHRQHCTRSRKPWISMSDDWFSVSPLSSAVSIADNLVSHVITNCLPVLGKRAIAKLSDVGFSMYAQVPEAAAASAKFEHDVVADASKTNMTGASERLVLADGGWMDASTPHNRCFMLQCGVALLSGGALSRAFKTQRRSDPTPDTGNNQSVIPGAAFVHLF